MSQAYDFLFVSDGELPFLMNSLKNLLDEGDFATGKIDINMKELGKLKDVPEIFILDAEVLLANAKARTFLYDTCIQHGKKIVLIGNQNELNGVFELTSVNVIAQSFERPINNNEVAEKLKDLVTSLRDNGMKKRILVVDDSPVFLRLMTEWLEEDYNVNVCPSATAAFHLIEKSKPDLILLDYEMPICNGAQFLQMIHGEKSTADIPVIFLTSRDDAETVKSLIALKPQGYLLKNQTKELTLNSISEFFFKEMTR